ncbi:hypothetical protein HDC94_001510 [Leifsonia sp. AK011]|uniref:YaaA family protein n=1 Tax=Leifsonia sp. AK011 TaxID=2723075 RepID=UPI0015CEABD9|nr:peroxide stress protein YaaA [Leifsonia sp. AK011]NYF10354.1 hypothetical protein [Leifsonia sp. AK011]
MLLLLPPSETKRDGGVAGTSLDLAALSFSQLGPQRRKALAALRTVSRTTSLATRALGLGPTQSFEVARNRAIGTSPLLPALERYTGVLYDGLDVTSLTPEQRAFAHEHVAIHSALFGMLAADDAIPAYRLSHDSRLPELSLRTLWRPAISSVLGSHDGLILDLRSEAYATLGPAPAGSWYLRVVTQNSAGRRVALSHFNKKAKGEFTRAVIVAGIDHPDVASLFAWAESSGLRLEQGAPGEIDLVVG